jgi:glutaredoxin
MPIVEAPMKLSDLKCRKSVPRERPFKLADGEGLFLHVYPNGRKLWRLGAPYRSIDLDSAAYQADNKGGRIRAALQARTGATTIPQIFINGALIGGATDVIAAAETGDLQSRLTGPHRTVSARVFAEMAPGAAALVS